MLMQQAPQQGSQQANIFENIVNTLLKRAASRLERGVATCLDCRGRGCTTCEACKGSGTTGPINKNTIGQDSLKKSHSQGAEKGERWLTTNRCMACKGKASIMCSSCAGSGLRATVRAEDVEKE